MADEIFSEIEEDLQKEKFKKFWRTYSKYIISIIIVIVISVGGWQIYRYWNFLTFEKASNDFFSVLEISLDNPQKAISAIGNINNFPGGYDDLINFKKVSLNLKIGNTDEANNILNKIYSDNSSDDGYKNLALVLSILNDNTRENILDFVNLKILEKNIYKLNLLEAKLSMLISLEKIKEAKLLLKEIKDLDNIPNNMKNRLEIIEYSIGKL